MCETSQVSSGCAAAERRPRPAGRARRSTRRAGRGCTRRSSGSGRCGRQPERPARRAAPRGRGRGRSREVGERPVSSRGRSGWAYAAKTRTPACRRGRGRLGPPDQQDLGRRSRPRRSRSAAPRPSGSRASRSASSPHGPGVLDQQEGADGRRRAGHRLVAQQRSRRRSGSRAASGGGSPRTTSSSPSRTRRRHSTSRLCASRCGRSRGRELGAGRGPPRARAGSGRARPGSGRRAAPRAGRRRSSSTQGWPGRRRSRVVSSSSRDGEHVEQAAARAAAGAVVRKRRTSALDRGVRRRRSRTRSASSSSRSAEALGEQRRGPRGSRPGRCSSPAPSSSRRARVRSTRPRQVSWLMPMVTCSETVSWARAACGVPVGRYIDRPGSSSTSSTPSGRVHLPLLGAGGLEDEDVVGVGVHGEALRAGRREVGVGLARVAELELELGDQLGQRRPVAVQPLEDDGRAVVEQRRAPCAASTSPVSGWPARVAPRVYDDSGSTAPSWASRTAGRADRRRRQQVVGVVEREQADEVARGRCGAGARATPRPSRGRSGRRR